MHIAYRLTKTGDMTNLSNALRIPDTMGPAEIGPYLRELREYFNLTPQDIADRVHIRVRYVTAIEDVRMDLLPGPVYARGYIHNYAEFLGLDADQVAAQYVENLKVGIASSAVEKPTRRRVAAPRTSLGWRNAAIVSLLLVGALVVATQLRETPTPEAPVPSVAPVPETMLSSMRSTVVPIAHNVNCLTGSLLLSCFYASNGIDQLHDLEVIPLFPSLKVLTAKLALRNPPTVAEESKEEIGEPEASSKAKAKKTKPAKETKPSKEASKTGAADKHTAISASPSKTHESAAPVEGATGD